MTRLAPEMTPEQRRRREQEFLAWVGTRIDWHHWKEGHALIREAYFAGIKQAQPRP